MKVLGDRLYGHFEMLQAKIGQKMFEIPKDFEHSICSIFQGAKRGGFLTKSGAPNGLWGWSYMVLRGFKKVQIQNIQFYKRADRYFVLPHISVTFG